MASAQKVIPWFAAMFLFGATGMTAPVEDSAVDFPPEASVSDLPEASLPEAPADEDILPLSDGNPETGRPLTPLSITIRGGSSLGAYEAGYLYMLTEAMKRNPRYFTPDVLSGASAGTINAILSIVSLGTPPQDNPLESIYYRIWTQLNFRELIDVADSQTPPGALSSRKLLWRISDELRAVWMRGFRRDLSVVVGISTTRLLPEKIITPGGMEIPNQQAKFVFRVTGQGIGQPPAMENHRWVKPGMEQLLLPFGLGAKTDFDVMMQVVFASCGIPIVFPPQPIDYCVTKIQENSELRCTETEKYTDSFVDGGVVDNSPIHLAYQVHKGIRKNAPEASETSRLSVRATDGAILLYLDPEHLKYPSNSSPDAKEGFGGIGEHREYEYGLNLFGTLPRFLRGFVNSSRSSEIYSLLNTDPAANIQRTENSFAPISAQLSGQFGFMEREILKYDFYLGMHDAENYLRTTVLAYLRRIVDPQIAASDIQLPQDSLASRAMSSWHPYRCMRAMFDGEGEPDEACTFGYGTDAPANPPDADNFRILIQVSIDRVYSHCALLEDTEKIREELAAEDGMCQDAFAAGIHARPPQVPNVLPLENDEWYRCMASQFARTDREKARARFVCHHHRKNEDEYQYVTRLMGAYGYEFRDLGLNRGQAQQIRAVIQNELFEILDVFAGKYRTIEGADDEGADWEADVAYTVGEVKGGDRALILTLGKPAITFLDYSPPRNILSFMVMKGASLSLSRSRSGWFRFNWNLFQLAGLDTMNDRLKVLTFVHSAGIEWQPPWLSTPVVQSTVIARLGYQLSTEKKFTDASCGDRMDESANRCSLPLAQTLLSVSFLSRIRLELGLDWFFPLHRTGLPNRHLNYGFNAAVGFQFLN